jgi:hypothetical protein
LKARQSSGAILPCEVSGSAAISDARLRETDGAARVPLSEALSIFGRASAEGRRTRESDRRLIDLFLTSDAVATWGVPFGAPRRRLTRYDWQKMVVDSEYRLIPRSYRQLRRTRILVLSITEVEVDEKTLLQHLPATTPKQPEQDGVGAEEEGTSRDAKRRAAKAALKELWETVKNRQSQMIVQEVIKRVRATCGGMEVSDRLVRGLVAQKRRAVSAAGKDRQ